MPEEPTKEAITARRVLAQIPFSFATAVAVVYSTGFLIEFSFCNSFQITDSVAEGFKAKYIYVGLLCLQFPVASGLLIFGSLRWFRTWKEAAKQAKLSKDREKLADAGEMRIYLSSILLLLLLLFSFYLLTAFAPPQIFQQYQVHIFALFVITFFTLYGLRLVEGWINKVIKHKPRYTALRIYEKYSYLTYRALRGWSNRLIKKKSRNPAFGTSIKWSGLWGATPRWILLLLSVFLFNDVFHTLWPDLLTMLGQGGYLYFAFLFVCFLNIYWTDKHRKFFSKSNLKLPALALSGCILLTFGYLSVLAFAYRIYPFIPVQRGGGNFATDETLPVILFFNTPKDLLPLNNQ